MRITRLAGALLLALSGTAFGQSNCVDRDLAVPSTVTGEITIGSCKQGSEYHDIYHIHGLTAGRQLRFVLTKTTLPNLKFELTRVQNLTIIDVINTSEYSKSSLTIDVEIPVTQDPYNVFISGITSYSTGGYSLSVMDLNTPNLSTQIVPIVGRLQGGGGSIFRSDLKLYNPTTTAMTGSLVFTPRGQSASGADASVRYNIPPQSVRFYEDVYSTAFPGGAGAARLAIVPDVPSAKPVVDSSTYTALADGGELAQTPTPFTSAMLFSGQKLVGMLGKSSERSNLFVMTGPADVTIAWRYRDANGVAMPAVTRSYPRDSTSQFPVSDIVGSTPGANGSIEATIQSGAARVALSPVNNISNQGRWIDFQVSP